MEGILSTINIDFFSSRNFIILDSLGPKRFLESQWFNTNFILFSSKGYLDKLLEPSQEHYRFAVDIFSFPDFIFTSSKGCLSCHNIVLLKYFNQVKLAVCYQQNVVKSDFKGPSLIQHWQRDLVTNPIHLSFCNVVGTKGRTSVTHCCSCVRWGPITCNTKWIYSDYLSRS